MERKIICICGVKGSGKDTLAEEIIKKEQKQYLHLKVSTMLKKVCSIVFGQEYETFERQELKEQELEQYEGKTPREIMQFMGTEVLQKKMQELLPKTGKILQIRQLVSQIKKQEIENIIISDVRFKHEIEELRREFKKVILVKIIREREGEKYMEHSSEKEVNSLQEDILIKNDKKKEDLYNEYKKWQK